MNWLLVLGGKIVWSKVKAAIRRKAVASVTSATMGSAAAIVAAGVWVQNNPSSLALLGDWQGVGLAVVGLVVAVARMRTLGR